MSRPASRNHKIDISAPPMMMTSELSDRKELDRDLEAHDSPIDFPEL